MQSRYFSESEFERCTPSCKRSDLSQDLLDALDYARSLYGRPIVLTSAYRSVEYEKQHKRSGTSSHCKGLAVDISCQSSETRIRLITALLRAGFRRIGVSDTFIHVDIDDDKPKSFWLY